jgi:hypothetical protein
VTRLLASGPRFEPPRLGQEFFRSSFFCDITPGHRTIGARFFRDSVVVSFSSVENVQWGIYKEGHSTLEREPTKLSRKIGHQSPTDPSPYPRRKETSNCIAAKTNKQTNKKHRNSPHHHHLQTTWSIIRCIPVTFLGVKSARTWR